VHRERERERERERKAERERARTRDLKQWVVFTELHEAFAMEDTQLGSLRTRAYLRIISS
jgi:hypothetical protein